MANHGLLKSYVAEAAIAPFRIVKFGAADGQVLMANAATDSMVGVTDVMGQTTVGQRADVVLADIADVEYGGAVTRGALLTADATGKAVVAAPAAGVNARYVGIAMVSGVAGDIGSVLVSPGSIQG